MALDIPPRTEQPITIVGAALPDSAAERAYNVERSGRRKIEQAASRQLDQLLKDLPGVQLFRRSDSRSGHPTSQGITLRALGGNASSRALLILDGVPQADPFGGWVNWPAYDPSDLAGIRVVRGGGSVAHGPGALAGTIEMTSRGDSGVGGEIDGGSRQSIDVNAYAGWVAGRSTFRLSWQGSRSDGFVPITRATRGPADEPAPYRQWNGRGRWLAAIGAVTEIQANLSGFRDWRARGTEFTQNRTSGADASLRVVSRGRWQWSALGYWQWRNLMSSFANISPGRTSATRVSLQDAVPSHGIGGSIELRPPTPSGMELRLGADARRTSGESRELFSYSAGVPTRRRLAGGNTLTSGAFGEATASSGNLTLTGGARVDHWQVTNGHLLEKVIATSATQRDENYAKRGGWLATARGGAVMTWDNGVSLRTAAYLGWRMPTLNELFRPFRAGLDATAANPGLDPEKLSGAEAGADYDHREIRLSITGFANRLKDAIGNVTLAHGPGTFPGVGFVAAGGAYRQRQNIDGLKVYGIEASASWTRGPWLAQAGVAWTHARMKTGGTSASLAGLRPAQTPNFAATLSLGYDQDGRSAQIVVRRVGAQFENDLNTRNLKAATTVDASASWPVARRLQIAARGENITNKLVMAGINGDGSVERATPRTIWLGLRLR